MTHSIWSIAVLTFKEGLRHRVLYGVFIFTILTMVFTILISGLFLRDIQKILLDLSLSTVSIGGLLVPFLLAINLLSRDIEQRTVFTILSRAISKTDYILGKYLGVSFITFTIMGLLSCSTIVTIQGAKLIYGESFFTTYNQTLILTSCTMAILGILVLNSCVFFWCSLTSSSFLITLLTIATYVIGQTSEDMARFISLNNTGVELSPLIQKTVQTALYVFPNLSAFDFKHQAAYGLSISSGEIALTTIYGFAYCSTALLLSIYFFSRRDLPQ